MDFVRVKHFTHQTQTTLCLLLSSWPPMPLSLFIATWVHENNVSIFQRNLVATEHLAMFQSHSAPKVADSWNPSNLEKGCFGFEFWLCWLLVAFLLFN